MINKKSTILNISAALITFLVQIFISFWLSPFVVSKLGEEAYGFINLANNFVSYASLLTVMVNSMASRYISVELNSGRINEAKRYYSTVFIANCFLFGIVIIFAILLVSRLEVVLNISASLIFQVKLAFLLSFINMGVSLLGTIYNSAAFATNKMHYSSIVQIISNIIKSIMMFALFTLLPAKVYLFSIATLIGGISMLIGNYVVSLKLLRGFKIDRNLFDFKKLIKLIKSGFWVLISNISNLLLNGLDLLLSNWFISNAIMGRLSLAKQIPYAFSSALGMFSNIFSSSLTMTFTKDGFNSTVEVTNNQIKILSMIFTVPYAGIIIFGKNFLKLWLGNGSYTNFQLNEIYILMILVLLDIIVSTYMYSIHSIFIALDKVKVYSVILLISSIISAVLTILLLILTDLGVYAIAGTSTIVLGIAHGIVVPALAAKLLHKPTNTFWKTELKSWIILCFMVIVFYFVGSFMNFPNWLYFFRNVIIIGIFGYLISFVLLFSKNEKRIIIEGIVKKIFSRK